MCDLERFPKSGHIYVRDPWKRFKIACMYFGEYVLVLEYTLALKSTCLLREHVFVLESMCLYWSTHLP